MIGAQEIAPLSTPAPLVRGFRSEGLMTTPTCPC